MAVERGLYKPGTDAYKRVGIEVKRGFDPDKYKKLIDNQSIRKKLDKKIKHQINTDEEVKRRE